MKTNVPKKEEIKKEWFVVDATDQVLGRLASEVAKVLRGKHKASFTPHLDCGDNVIVVNAEKIVMTGRKAESKVYQNYSGYPGGLKETSFREQMEKKPQNIVFDAIRGMLPKNRLGRKIVENLRVYAGENHPHEAQTPKKLEI